MDETKIEEITSISVNEPKIEEITIRPIQEDKISEIDSSLIVEPKLEEVTDIITPTNNTLIQPNLELEKPNQDDVTVNSDSINRKTIKFEGQ
jgi:hypothetical protein